VRHSILRMLGRGRRDYCESGGVFAGEEGGHASSVCSLFSLSLSLSLSLSSLSLSPPPLPPPLTCSSIDSSFCLFVEDTGPFYLSGPSSHLFTIYDFGKGTVIFISMVDNLAMEASVSGHTTVRV
jgi:hypothetical protein